MTKDEIIKLAREAGFVVDGDSWIHAGAVLIDGRKSIDKQLKAFANLVAVHKAEVALAEAYRCGVEAGAAAEREACAKVCSEAAIKLFGGKSRVSQIDRHTAGVLQDTAKAIRARGNT